MKECYFDPETRAIIDLVRERSLDGSILYQITRINVPAIHRGQKHGSKLLDQVLADADAEQVHLVLTPLPSGGLSRTALLAWYKRRGFAWKRDFLGRYLYRAPKISAKRLVNHGVYRLHGDLEETGKVYEYIEYMDGPAGDELGRLHELDMRAPEPQILRGGSRWDVRATGVLEWRGAWYGASTTDLELLLQV